MKAFVIYDSFFGNTEKIAHVIGEALSQAGPVEVVRVGDVRSDQIEGADLVVVGSPTRAFQATKPIQELLKSIPVKGAKTAAFDTRVNVKQVNNAFLTVMVKLFGYAAEPIAKKLQKRGGNLALPAEGFIVLDSEGPLKEGELERAAAWARQLI